MREILFRGKRVDNGVWVEGSLIQTLVEESRENNVVNLRPACFIRFFDGSLCYEVEEDTVGQYTGLTDKNGKEIFEGDILEYDFGEVLYGIIGEPYKLGKRNATVYYSSKYHSFLLKPCGDFAFKEMNDGIVIGNIYDNPELIGGEKQ